MVHNIVNLANCGVLAPRIALQDLSFIPNVDEYIKEMREYNEYVDNRKKDTQNNNRGGVNETNLQRQNQEPIDRGQERNIVNATLGESQNISVNKVE